MKKSTVVAPLAASNGFVRNAQVANNICQSQSNQVETLAGNRCSVSKKKKKKINKQKSIYPNTVGTSAGKSLRRTKTSKLYILAMVSPENSSFKKVASVREQKISSKTLRDRKIIQLILHSVCQYDNFSQYYSISEPVVVNAFFHKQHSHRFSVNLKSQFFTHISRYIIFIRGSRWQTRRPQILMLQLRYRLHR